MDKRTWPARSRPRPVSHAERNLPRVASRQTAIPGNRTKREDGAIAVVTQVKNARETDCGIPGLVPVAVLVLAVDQICDPASDRRIADLSARNQSEQSLGSLRRGAVGRIAVRRTRPVGFAPFPPAAVLVLASDEPVDGAPHLRRIGRQAGAVEGGENRPSPIDIVGSPPAEPAAVGLLLGS